MTDDSRFSAELRLTLAFSGERKRVRWNAGLGVWAPRLKHETFERGAWAKENVRELLGVDCPADVVEEKDQPPPLWREDIATVPGRWVEEQAGPDRVFDAARIDP